VDAFNEHKDKLVNTEDWLHSLAYCKSTDEFQKVGRPICDAIVLPKCPLLFPETPFKSMETFLIQHGIHVKSVYQAVKKDCIFVALSESRNEFTPELVAKLKSAIMTLRRKT
jgi:hypothetical protein